ncbi:MAG: Flagellin N-methylase [Cyanobacteria bacterium RYN_339]|nr:Flagellin N-methylase [Cyanobacteria bacterium RYN_339]
MIDFAKRYLQALGSPDGGALFDLHAAEAPLLIDGKMVARGVADRDAFVASHQAALAGLRAGQSGFPDRGEPTLDSWDPAGVLRFSVPDPQRDAPARVAMGLVQEAGEWRIGWVTIADGPPRDYAWGRAAALGDFPFLPSQQVSRSRDWLDLAYRRRYRLGRPTLHFLPGANFGCHATSSCCRERYEISVPPEAQAFLDALPWEGEEAHLRGVQLASKADGNLMLKAPGEVCRFLDGKGHCRIHARLGTPVFAPCVKYPVQFVEVPDGVAVSLNFRCGSACEGFGPPLEEQADELYNRLALGGMSGMPDALLLAHDRATDWDGLAAAEQDLLTALQGPGEIWRRLWVGLRALEARVAGEIPDLARYAVEALPPLPDPADTREELQVLLGHISLASPELAHIEHVYPRAHPLMAQERVAQFLANFIHSKYLTYILDLSTAANTAVLLYALVLALETATGPEGPQANTWIAKGALPSPLVLGPTLLGVISANPARLAELGTPALGLGFLRALAT